MIDVRWITVMFDLPSPAAEDFWCAFTASTLSARRGDRGQFATLVPRDGDPHLRAQRLDDGPRVHLDLHVADPDGAAEIAARLGGRVERIEDGLHLLWSPAGIVGCLVADSGERARTSPVPMPGGGSTLLDQVGLDVPATEFGAELDFWRTLTGWAPTGDPTRDLVPLHRPAELPVRIMLQRLRTGPAGAHPDLAAGPDRRAAVARAVSLGARTVSEFDRWTVLADPAGLPFCLTDRDPATGLLPL